ncbi:MAG: hypothetical protein E7813_10540 [Bradyrhizobium sp.]|uniref:hypothetical protein n=1 Tax=Bradyrhizobium sp. TaxID=376 RepID=UPI00120E27C7|nr:hypothetical protein [Bradyrhizobium sp.]THD68457.1 MAG: hypothetical protein E7813_10540 [Bradyrhizobium sp.]
MQPTEPIEGLRRWRRSRRATTVANRRPREFTIDDSTRRVGEATAETMQMLIKSGVVFDEPVDFAADN